MLVRKLNVQRWSMSASDGMRLLYSGFLTRYDGDILILG